MGVTYTGLEEHEGYAARRLADGTITGSWHSNQAATVAYLPACGCGWRGGLEIASSDDYDEAAEDRVLDVWRDEHAGPLRRARADEAARLRTSIRELEHRAAAKGFRGVADALDRISSLLEEE